MSGEAGRWQRIRSLFQATLDRPEAERARFLREVCSDDSDLRRAVESLLEAHGRAPSQFMSRPAIDGMAGSTAERFAEAVREPPGDADGDRSSAMTHIATGSWIGDYQIRGRLGEGGMGVVYRARDTKLGRDVAIKVLPASFTTDSERLARFEREARVLASLNHPHIAAIYGVEETDDAPALVLELVEGETIAERLLAARETGLGVRDALSIAAQIASALDAAHERGIIHRDLKPANIKITPEGEVKVLDFGLAKAAVDAPFDALTNSPTMMDATRDGMLLGTAPYMSPEQVRAKPVDKRADIWAFGCVLFEMLTGHRAFDGETLADLMAAVLDRAPDWNELPRATPESVRRLLGRCLEKDLRQRQRDIGDARLDIMDAESAVHDGPPEPMHKAGRTPLLIALVAGLAIGAAGVWSISRRADSTSAADRVRRMTVRALSGTGWGESVFVGVLRGSRVIALSPDGTRLVYAGAGEGSPGLFVRALDQPDARPLEGTNGASAPFWSPDGQWIAFFTSGKLMKVPLSGGPAIAVCDASDNIGGASGSWGPDGTIVFALPVSARAGLMRVPASGGTPTMLTTPDSREGGSHADPAFTIDGRAVIFTTRQTLFGAIAPSIMVRSLVTGEQRKLTEGTNRPVHTRSGHLVFGRGSAVFAAVFDANNLRVASTPVPVQDGVVPGQVDVSADGLLAYVEEPRVDGRSLMWVERTGASTPALAEMRGFARPRLSPDGRRLIVDSAHETADSEERSSDVWMYNFENGAFTRLSNTGRANSPFWTPDGHRIAFRTGGSLVWQAADGSGSVESLIDRTDKALKPGSSVAPGDWSPDGRTMLFVVHTSVASGGDIWALNLAPTRRITPIVQRPGDQWGVRISPDGRWMSYASNESGRFEIFVEPFGGGARHQVSTDGGEQAIWSPKGDELFYRVGDQMMAASVTLTASSFAAGRPHVLFRGRYVSTDLAAYDVSPDGKRFLMVRPSEDEQRPAEISIVENWFSELRRVVPGN